MHMSLAQASLELVKFLLQPPVAGMTDRPELSDLAA